MGSLHRLRSVVCQKTVQGPFNATFTFSETVAGFEAKDITVSNAKVGKFSGKGKVYTALITPVKSGKVVIDVGAKVAKDAAGNGNVAAKQVTTLFDAIAPSVAISGVPKAVQGPFSATFTFSEDVTGFEVKNITVSNAKVGKFSVKSKKVYTALITPVKSGKVTIDVGAKVAKDAAGNGNVAARQITTVFDVKAPKDVIAPTVAISGVAKTVKGPFSATFTFSEDVGGFAAGDITVSNAKVGKLSVKSKKVYTALITPVKPGKVTIDVGAKVAKDAAGNGNVAAKQVTTLFDAKAPKDVIAPSVAIGGVAKSVKGPFSATFTFSEAVTGFEAKDITVLNAKVGKFSVKSKKVYKALITPTKPGKVTIDVGAKVAKDAAGNGNIAARQVTTNYIDVKLVRSRTQRVISNFMSRRADQITASDPDISERLTGSRGTGAVNPFNFSGNGTFKNNQVRFSTSLRQTLHAQEAKKAAKRDELLTPGAFGYDNSKSTYQGLSENGFDVWTKGQWGQVSSDQTKSDLGLLHVGADYRFNSDLVVGLLGQVDWVKEKDASQQYSASGRGWLLGPYMAARLHQNLLFDGRVGWGLSSNQFSPLGTYTDKSSSERWLVKGQLTGDFKWNSWQLQPQLGVVYYSEEQKAYRDSLGILIPGQQVSLGRFTFGPKVSSQFEMPNGMVVSPYLSMKGIWDFDKAETVNLETGLAASTSGDLRGRAEGGLTLEMPSGITLQGSGFYDGIGDRNLEAYGGSVEFTVPLH